MSTYNIFIDTASAVTGGVTSISLPTEGNHSNIRAHIGENLMITKGRLYLDSFIIVLKSTNVQTTATEDESRGLQIVRISTNIQLQNTFSTALGVRQNILYLGLPLKITSTYNTSTIAVSNAEFICPTYRWNNPSGSYFDLKSVNINDINIKLERYAQGAADGTANTAAVLSEFKEIKQVVMSLRIIDESDLPSPKEIHEWMREFIRTEYVRKQRDIQAPLHQ